MKNKQRIFPNLNPSSSTLSQENIHPIRDYLFLVIWGLAFCVWGIQLGSLASWDEAYYALVSKGIAQSGDWINLKFFGNDFYDKPPLYMWMTALFYKLGGINEFTSRLTSGLAGVGTVVVTYALGSKLFDNRVGLAGAGVLVSSTDFLHYSRWGTLDITHLFFFTSAIYLFYLAKEKPVFWYAFWASCSAAILTKGPIIVLAWLILGIDSLCRRDFSYLKRKELWLGLVLALFLVLPWHLAAYFHNPERFMRDFIHKHYISRTFGAVEGHFGTYYYYIRTLINKYHPWIVLVAVSLPWTIWQALKAKKKESQRLLWIWITVIWVFFTFLVQTKLKWYILPIHPALSLSVGVVLSAWIKKKFNLSMKIIIAVSLLLHIPLSSVLVHDYSPGLKALAPLVQQKLEKQEIIYLYDYHEQPASLFYLDRNTKYIDSIADLDKRLQSREELWMIVRDERFQQLKKKFVERGFGILEETQGLEHDLVFLHRSITQLPQIPSATPE